MEAIETEFIPLLVYNNKQGQDAQVLKRFKEPSWNNPVFRFLNHESKDIIPRKGSVWALAGVTERLVAALKKAKRDVPVYLKALHKELNVKTKTATFAMHCYWDGEAKLGSIEGVLGTRAGWYGGQEVVELRYDPETVALKSLIKEAKKFHCASKVYVPDQAGLAIARKEVGGLAEIQRGAVRDAKASDQKFALNRSVYKYLPLTPCQATKVNAALRLSKDVQPCLSPRQQKLLTRIKACLKDKSDSLKGFKRPKQFKDLTEYQEKLLLKLSKLEAQKSQKKTP